MPQGNCSIEGCTRTAIRRGWCGAHYARWRRHGDPLGGGTDRLSYGPGTCLIGGCELPRVTRGWCANHYARWQAHGDPLGGRFYQDTCSIEGCDHKHLARGWCLMHYGRWQRHGDPLRTVRLRGADLADRFWPRVDQAGPVPAHRPDLGSCWLWTASRRKQGYGDLRFQDVGLLAHRVAYELVIGPIPDGLVLDHLCHNDSDCPGGPTCPHRACVNPSHLEPVTNETNIARGKAADLFRRRQSLVRASKEVLRTTSRVTATSVVDY